MHRRGLAIKLEEDSRVAVTNRHVLIPITVLDILLLLSKVLSRLILSAEGLIGSHIGMLGLVLWHLERFITLRRGTEKRDRVLDQLLNAWISHKQIALVVAHVAEQVDDGVDCLQLVHIFCQLVAELLHALHFIKLTAELKDDLDGGLQPVLELVGFIL